MVGVGNLNYIAFVRREQAKADGILAWMETLARRGWQFSAVEATWEQTLHAPDVTIITERGAISGPLANTVHQAADIGGGLLDVAVGGVWLQLGFSGVNSAHPSVTLSLAGSARLASDDQAAPALSALAQGAGASLTFVAPVSIFMESVANLARALEPDYGLAYDDLIAPRAPESIADLTAHIVDSLSAGAIPQPTQFVRPVIYQTLGASSAAPDSLASMLSAPGTSIERLAHGGAIVRSQEGAVALETDLAEWLFAEGRLRERSLEEDYRRRQAQQLRPESRVAERVYVHGMAYFERAVEVARSTGDEHLISRCESRLARFRTYGRALAGLAPLSPTSPAS